MDHEDFRSSERAIFAFDYVALETQVRADVN